jgi:hypothetical protein
MRTECINWERQEPFREEGELWNRLFRADYEDLELVFGVPVTHNNLYPGIIGYFRLTKKRNGRPTESWRFKLDQNAVLDLQFGLAIIASNQLRPPYTEFVLTDGDDDSPDARQDDGQDTAA